MRVIIIGSPTITDSQEVTRAIKASGFPIKYALTTEGRMARTVEQYAASKGIPMRAFESNFVAHRDGTAIIYRNENMVKCGDAVIAMIDEENPGLEVSHMVKLATGLGLKVYEHRCKVVKIEPKVPIKPDYMKIRKGEE